MKILLTGFDTFNNAEINPSYEAIKNIKIASCQIEIIKVPVCYNECFDCVLNKIKDFRPDYVISFGLAASRSFITPELVAINYMYASIPDNNNVLKKGEEIGDSDKAYFTQIKINEIIDELNKENDVYRLSLSAGAYVCNNLYYHLLENENKYNYKALFIHVPPLNIMELSKMEEYITKLIERVIKIN